MTEREALDLCRGALADIAFSDDLTRDGMRKKAARIYEETASVVATDPTPAQLREMAEWFEDPIKSPDIIVRAGMVLEWGHYTPGYLLRLIADGLEKAQQGDRP